MKGVKLSRRYVYIVTYWYKCGISRYFIDKSRLEKIKQFHKLSQYAQTKKFGHIFTASILLFMTLNLGSKNFFYCIYWTLKTFYYLTEDKWRFFFNIICIIIVLLNDLNNKTIQCCQLMNSDVFTELAPRPIQLPCPWMFHILCVVCPLRRRPKTRELKTSGLIANR